MSYEEFKSEYSNLFTKMMKYSPGQAGANIYADKMAELANQYPEFEERIDNES